MRGCLYIYGNNHYLHGQRTTDDSSSELQSVGQKQQGARASASGKVVVLVLVL